MIGTSSLKAGRAGGGLPSSDTYQSPQTSSSLQSMSSIITLALFAQAVLANPVNRRQVTATSIATNVTVEPTLTANATATAEPTLTTNITATAEPTLTANITTTDEPITFTDPSTDTFTVPITATTTSAIPSPTGGSNDGGYWLCSFPGAEATATATATSDPTTIADPFPTTTADDTTIIADPTVTDTDTAIPTATDTSTLTVPEVTDTDTTVPTETLTDTNIPTATETATDTDVPTVTDTLITATLPDPTVTSDPAATVTLAARHARAQTYTVVGPSTTAVIKCVRVWGGRPGRPHHPYPHPNPPHHSQGSSQIFSPLPTSDVYTTDTFAASTITDASPAATPVSSYTDIPTTTFGVVG
ncbi:unnamed protein product [Rhizoctonia solani]|uniref:Uncharacterized protein n=1 Tax=Rhizoctonia solani TaxID=456999 RepID=A0A8H3H6W8_9AGAM|nr:unnamed protein product [Rhizoctonia solani]